MGVLLAIPILAIPIILFFSKHGITYWLYFTITYIYLSVKNIFIKKRFDLYDFKAEGCPEKNGFFAAKEEWEIEPPRTDNELSKYSDNVFLFGTNSKSEYLAANVSRSPNSYVQCSLVLCINNKIYTLPSEHNIQRATSEENTFGSSRFKVQCLLPMRKWRIFFNGLLTEQEMGVKDKYNGPLKHVKFSFIWTASSDAFDFCYDQSKYQICDAIGKSALFEWPTITYKRLCKIFDTYEQAGMLLGTVNIEGNSEKEVYLWGCRQRYIGKNQRFRQGKCMEIYSNFKNGSILHLGVLNNSGIVGKIIYGYIMKPNGFIFPIDKVKGDIDSLSSLRPFKVLSDGKWYDIKISQIGSNAAFQKEFTDDTNIGTVEMLANDMEGKGFIINGCCSEMDETEKLIKRRRTISMAAEKEQPIFCTSFRESCCQNSLLSGGKGSSLATLYSLGKLTKSNGLLNKFNVPKGVVVTTDSYYEFTKGQLKDSLEKLQSQIWSNDGDRETNCKRMMELVENATLPDNVAASVISKLKEEMGEDIFERKFAVRSSATGEDTEQMSAAGQMETFLGVKGIDEILNAVKKCWASQFSFQAVEYKRGYGQLINSPMAVVIQEMVACDVAGVMFTCNPVTGNPSYINITANWGLGESVVSASAEPDTVILKRNISGKLELKETQMGNKKTKIVMDGQTGTREVSVESEESQICCINEEISIKLGEIGHEVEKHYGTPRDIEWGIVSGDIFLFQSRPVTSIDQETEFETTHTFDNFLRSEREYITKANVGEVMPGATSPLGIDLLHKLFEQCEHRKVMSFNEGAGPNKPYFQKGLVTAYSHIFINLIGGFLTLEKGREEETNSFIIALFGRLIDLSDMRKSSEGRLRPRLSIFKIIFAIFYMTWMMFFSGIWAMLEAKRLKARKISCKGMKSSRAFYEIARHSVVTTDGMLAHMNCTFSSSLWNMNMLKLLSKAKGCWDNDVFSDFAFLLSTCTEVESANIPISIQDIGVSLSKEIKLEVFKQMTDQDIIHFLKTSKSEAGKKFEKFIERHGHRCLKEFDVHTETWRTNPIPVIRMLKNFLDSPSQESAPKEIPTFDTISSKLKINLGFKNRFRLGRWILPNARRGVRNREYTKSLSILTIDIVRRPLNTLAEILVKEGRLPRKELMFFLCIDEIQQLTKTRSPRLIAKATRRERLHDKLDKLVFPEICAGITKPIEEEEIQVSGKGFKMTGVPVSQGVVKATARVVMTIDEAKSIQKGDILITYSTDIGWSPYFPLLSGVVTELGGLISHGAVVAREYGLPCAVSLHGATRAFKSGDIVILDGGNGTLQKVDED